MLHNEHLRRADESYEIRHDNSGNVIHVLISDSEAIVFPTLWDLIRYEYYLDGHDTERFYVSEENLSKVYDCESYNYYLVKKYAQDNNLLLNN